MVFFYDMKYIPLYYILNVKDNYLLEFTDNSRQISSFKYLDEFLDNEVILYVIIELSSCVCQA